LEIVKKIIESNNKIIILSFFIVCSRNMHE
jgi:hypothetical protein